MSKFVISILKDTNRIVSSSESNWATVRPGSYIKIDNDECFYTVAQTKQIFYIKDFQRIALNVIKINSDSGINLTEGDTLTISVKEFELNAIVGHEEGGIKYRIGDIVIPNGGTPVLDKVNNISQVTKFRIEDVDAKGGITLLSLIDKGKYLVPPSQKSPLIGGSGSDGFIQLSYQLIDDRALFEAIIDLVDKSVAGETNLRLTYPLPMGIVDGKLSVSKFEIFLTGMYLGNSQYHVRYQVFSDFTPNISLPLLVRNNGAHHLVFNNSMNLIDEEISQLKKRITQLERDSPSKVLAG